MVVTFGWFDSPARLNCLTLPSRSWYPWAMAKRKKASKPLPKYGRATIHLHHHGSKCTVDEIPTPPAIPEPIIIDPMEKLTELIKDFHRYAALAIAMASDKKAARSFADESSFQMQALLREARK